MFQKKYIDSPKTPRQKNLTRHKLYSVNYLIFHNI